jgi:hypothetical protein
MKQATNTPFLQPYAAHHLTNLSDFMIFSFFLSFFFCQNLFVYFLASIPICLYARSVFGAMDSVLLFAYAISLISIYELLFGLLSISVM